jgi:transposase
MVKRPVELPDNLPACHAVILQQAERIEELEARVDQLLARVDELVREVAGLKRQLYGSRRERFVPERADQDASTPGPPDAEPPAAGPDVALPAHDLTATSTTPRSSPGRRPRTVDPSIPREKVYHPLEEKDVPPEIWHHPKARRFFRFVREEVELPQRRLRVIEHYQEVIVVDDEEEVASQLLTAPVPPPLIERCYVGPSFLAYLTVSRFADHIPYYREEDILTRSGYSIHRSTQWRWMRWVSQLVLPLVELMRTRTLASKVLGIDETPCPLLCPPLGRTRQAYVYAQYGDAAHPYDCYYFASHKTRAQIQTILGDFHGYLQSDAYICYELITAASENKIIGVGCWAHARRKFEPLVVSGPHPQATWILTEIQKLYDIEDRARTMSDEERHALRQRASRPIVDSIRVWLDDRHAHELPKSSLRPGINYMRNRWDVFVRFLEDGAIGIDNNATEAAIKGPVMGKKAWLFLGNEHSGETAAILYTLTMTCKRHCIDVQAYLQDVFARIKDATPTELESLLPDHWIEQHPEARIRQRVQESHAAAFRKRTRRARRRAMAGRR